MKLFPPKYGSFETSIRDQAQDKTRRMESKCFILKISWIFFYQGMVSLDT